MDPLPERIPLLETNAKGCVKTVFQRIPAGSEESKMLSEADWDGVIVKNISTLSSALREAGVIENDSTLRVLGTQIDHVDIVLAEIDGEDDVDGSDQDPEGWGELRRLVLVEDKLVRSTEASRQVLAQIVDYGRMAEEQWDAESLIGKLEGCSIWLRRNARRLEHTLKFGEYLLVIAGDHIDQRLQELAERFAGQDDPLNLSELCLVSMALYTDDKNVLLIPHVVSAVQRGTREITIRVQVQNAVDEELAAEVSLLEGTSGKGPRTKTQTRPEVKRFLEGLRTSLDSRFLGPESSFRATDSPKKSLEYYLKNEDGHTSFKVHFGGYVLNQWSPIQVGVYTVAVDRDRREKMRLILKKLCDDGKLPSGVAVTTYGNQTVTALREYPWDVNDASALTDVLADSISRALLAFVDAVEPELR